MVCFSYEGNSPTSPVRPGVDYKHKFGNFPVAGNDSHVIKIDDRPPTLPPRNYRRKSGASSGPASGSKKSAQPLPHATTTPTQHSNSGSEGKAQGLGEFQAQSQQTPPLQPAGTFKIGPGAPVTPPRNVNMDTYGGDYDSTPKADIYADQLRQQALRISKSQRSLLSGARYQSKPLAQMNTSISMSRPVEQPPIAQQAKMPQLPPLPSSTEVRVTVSGVKPSPASLSTSPESRLPQTVPNDTRVPQPIHRSAVIPQDLNYVGLSDSDNSLEQHSSKSPNNHSRSPEPTSGATLRSTSSSPNPLVEMASPSKPLQSQPTQAFVSMVSPQGAAVTVVSPQVAAPLRSTAGEAAGRYAEKEQPPPPPPLEDQHTLPPPPTPGGTTAAQQDQ